MNNLKARVVEIIKVTTRNHTTYESHGFDIFARELADRLVRIGRRGIR